MEDRANPVSDLIKKSWGQDSSRGFLDRIKAMLLQDKSLLELADNHGYRPLHWAAYRGPIEVVKLLLEMGADKTALTDNELTPAELVGSGSMPLVKQKAVLKLLAKNVQLGLF